MTSLWCLCLISSTFAHWSSVSIVELKQVHAGWADGDIQEMHHSAKSPVEWVNLEYKLLIEWQNGGVLIKNAMLPRNQF